MRPAWAGVLACLAVGLARAGDTQPVVPLYPGSRSIPVSGALVLPGYAHHVTWFVAPGSPAQVLEHAASHWRGQGLPVVQDVVGQGEGVVSAFLFDRRQLAVIAWPHPRGSAGFAVVRVPTLPATRQLTGQEGRP